MVFVSVTRLRLRSLRFLPAFLWHAVASDWQARRTPGCLGVREMRDPDGSFWTVSAWENRDAMRAYIAAGAHRRAMPKLMEWCDEASIAHWEQAKAELPGWAEARRRIAEEGRPSKVRRPSPAQAAALSRG